MTDDSTVPVARQLLAELEATEAYLRVLASSSLPYGSVLAVERRAQRRCNELLAGFTDTFALDLVDDATDELLSAVVRPRDLAGAVRQTTDSQVLASADAVASPAPLDEGPEGAADDGNELVSEEHEPASSEEVIAAPAASSEHEEEVDDEDTSQGQRSPLVSEAQERTEEASSDEATPALDFDSLVSFEEGDADEGELAYVSYDDDGQVEEEERTLELEEEEDEPEQAASEPEQAGGFDALVSFEEPPRDEQDDTQVVTREALEAQTSSDDAFDDVGTDALVTLTPGSDDLLDDALDEVDASSDIDLEELELEPDEGEGVETFDLMPDLAEIDEVEELELEEVAVDDADGATPRAAPTRVQVGKAPAPRVTAGLYGNPSVPTIRDGNDPKPRAAAIQINASTGQGKVLGLEEEDEPIAIGAAEDYDEDYDDADSSDGFSLSLQEYESDDELEEYDDEDEDEEVIQQAAAPPPPPKGPTPEELAALLVKAREAAEQGDMEQGVTLFSDVIDLDPDHADAHVGRGRLYLDLGDYSRAMSDFMVAEDIEPENPEPQIAIGDLYFARKDYRRAIDYFNAALEVSPNHAMAFCRRGISHYYRKNYSQALDDLNRAEGLDQNIPNIGTYIGMAKKKAGSSSRRR